MVPAIRTPLPHLRGMYCISQPTKLERSLPHPVFQLPFIPLLLCLGATGPLLDRSSFRHLLVNRNTVVGPGIPAGSPCALKTLEASRRAEFVSRLTHESVEQTQLVHTVCVLVAGCLLATRAASWTSLTKGHLPMFSHDCAFKRKSLDCGPLLRSKEKVWTVALC